MSLEERRAWLFPPGRGTWQGIDLDALDPADAGSRSVLIRAEHPTMDDALRREGDELDAAPGAVNPHLHLAMHELVAASLWEGDPPALGATADRLRDLGYDRHAVLHMLGTVVAEEVWRAGRGLAALDASERDALLEALPASWEDPEQGAGEQSANWDTDLEAEGFGDDELDDTELEAEGFGDDELDDTELDDTAIDDEESFDLLASAHEAIATRGPLSEDELAEVLGGDVEALDVVIRHPSICTLAGERIGSGLAALEGVTLTHRVRAREPARVSPDVGTHLHVGTDLHVLTAFLCDADHLHLAGTTVAWLDERPDEDGWEETAEGEGVGDSSEVLSVPVDLEPGELVGFRVPQGAGWLPELEIVRPESAPPATDALAAQMVESFNRLAGDDPVPVRALDLLCQMAADSPDGLSGTLPPLSEVVALAGFRERAGHVGPPDADWETFGRCQEVLRLSAGQGLDPSSSVVVLLLVEAARALVATLESPPPLEDRTHRGLARLVEAIASVPEIAEAFAAAMHQDEARARAFLRLLGQSTGRRQASGLLWAESLVAARMGDVEGAEACLHAALAASPGGALLDAILEDCAWYASDRGDAAAAARYLQRAETDDGGRLALLEQLARPPSPRVGRNAPCPCGSGRKHKVCCLPLAGTAAATPLPGRVRWLWEKLRWWLERLGPFERLTEVTITLHGSEPSATGDPTMALAVDMDIAASLVLFADGAVRSFLEQRHSLLPADEANLVAQWALAPLSVFEVTGIRRGAGFDLRDVRTGDVVTVQERQGSRQVAVGDLLLAHPVFDGSRHQVVGGIVPVPLRLRDRLVEALDAEVGALGVARLLRAGRRPPTLVTAEGEPTVLCRADYDLADPDAAARRLDQILQRQGEGRGHWAELAEVRGEPIVRATVSVDGTRLVVAANSERRFERIRALLEDAIEGLTLTDEVRETLPEASKRLHEEERAGGRPRSAADDGQGTSVLASPPPEVAAALAELMRAREVRWLDEPIPALHGLTPRQAADDPSRREDLVALLHEYERTPVPQGASTYDVARLRALLGLAET